MHCTKLLAEFKFQVHFIAHFLNVQFFSGSIPAVSVLPSVVEVPSECMLVVVRAPPRPSPGSIQYDDGANVELYEMMPSLHSDEDSGNASDHAAQATGFFLPFHVTILLYACIIWHK